MKRGSLSKEEKQFIEHNRNLSISEMAEDLDRSEGIVQKHLASLPVEEPKEEKKETLFSRSMGRVGEKGKAKFEGAVAMTPTSSEISDNTRKKGKDFGKHKNCIHKIR